MSGADGCFVVTGPDSGDIIKVPFLHMQLATTSLFSQVLGSYEV